MRTGDGESDFRFGEIFHVGDEAGGAERVVAARKCHPDGCVAGVFVAANETREFVGSRGGDGLVNGILIFDLGIIKGLVRVFV